MKRWKSALPENAKNSKFVNELPRLYVLVKYAWYAVDDVPYVYTAIIDGKPTPMVYQWTDHNGAFAEWQLIPVTAVTSGGVYCWSIHRSVIATLAQHENELLEKKYGH